MKRLFKFISNLIYKVYFRIRLKRMDSAWRFWGGSGFSLFPPSFYYTHTEDEINRITNDTLAELKKMLADYDAKYNTGSQKHRK